MKERDSSLLFEKYRGLERGVYCILLFSLLLSSVINCMLSLQIIQAQTVSQFLDLLTNYWVQNTFIGAFVILCMEQMYTSTSLIILLFSCIKLFEVILITLFCVYLLQLSVTKTFLVRQRSLFICFILRSLSFVGFIIFVGLAVQSKTTGSAFAMLHNGAIVYGIGNILCILYGFLSIKKVRDFRTLR